MQHRAVVLRPSAIDDLESLANYIIEMHGLPRTALAHIELIQLRCAALGDFAFAGRRRDDLGAGILTLPYKSVLIIYEVSDTKVLVRRIVGQAQDVSRLKLD